MNTAHLGAAENRVNPVVLRPWFIWRVAAPIMTGVVLLVSVGVVDRQGPGLGLLGWFFSGIALWMTIAAFRQRIEIRGIVLTRRGMFRWYSPLSVDQVREVSLHYESGLKDFPHRVLWLYGGPRPQAFPLRWWGHHELIAAWLATHRSHRDNDELAFDRDLEMDAKTERRLLEAAQSALPAAR